MQKCTYQGRIFTRENTIKGNRLQVFLALGGALNRNEVNYSDEAIIAVGAFMFKGCNFNAEIR